MSKKVTVPVDIHGNVQNLSDSTDDDDVSQPVQHQKRSLSSTEETDQSPSNNDIIKMLLQQNQTLMKLMEKG